MNAATSEARKFSPRRADDQRRVAPGADEQVRLVGVDGHQREGSVEAAADGPHGLGRSPPHAGSAGQMGYDSESVSLESGTPASASLSQLGEVLDDAVVDDRDPRVAADVRVGIDVVGAPWWGPAGVTDAGGAVRQRVLANSASRFASLPARLRV